VKIKKKNRLFKVKVGNGYINIKDTAHLYLENNEQITLKNKSLEYDITRKNWGYYATPSINGRLKKFGYRCFLVENSFKKIYVMLVDKTKLNTFKNYIKKDNQKILLELTNGKQNIRK
jgi:hypothetical protein